MRRFRAADMLLSYAGTSMTGAPELYTGRLDDTPLDRNEQYEVLYLIRRIMSQHLLHDVRTGQKIERMIRACPKRIRTRRGVWEWVVGVWEEW
jgi:hypothetical protein